MIQEKNLFYKKYLKPNYQETLQAFTQIQQRVRLAIENSKRKYYEKLLNKPLNSKLGKCYWTILTRFLTKKTSLQTSLLYEDKFVTDFPEKRYFREIFSLCQAMFSFE